MVEIGGGWAARTFSALLGGARRARLRRRTIAELYALDDRTLKDIGISRLGIPAVATRVSRD